MKRLFSGSALVGLGLCFAQSAFAANLPMPATAPPPKPPHTWTGFYLGANMSFPWADPVTFTAADPLNTFGSAIAPISMSAADIGFVFGPTLGYNLQMGNWLIGAEGDIDWGVLSLSNQQPLVNLAGVPLAGLANSFSSKLELSSLSTVRGRAGFIWNNPENPKNPFNMAGDFLFYGTGGVGWAQTGYTANVSCSAVGGACGPPGLQAPITVNATRSGAVWGGGVEWMGEASKWHIVCGIEYLHYSFKGETATGLVVNSVTGAPVVPGATIPYAHNDLNINDIRVRVSYIWN